MNNHEHLMNTPIRFTKLSATGNDFILIDNRTYRFSETDKAFFRQICRRRISVGADGVLLLNASERCDFLLRYFNADGSEAECGNGARTAAFYASKRMFSKASLRFEFGVGIYEANVNGQHVRLKLPPVRDVIERPGFVEEDVFEEAGSVNTGVPHYVLFCDDLPRLDVLTYGKKYRYHEEFQPAGTNVDFVQVNDKGISVRTYERGVEDETLACGTGTVATALFANRAKGFQFPVRVNTQGGVLTVDHDESGVFFLTGQVREIYEGILIQG